MKDIATAFPYQEWEVSEYRALLEYASVKKNRNRSNKAEKEIRRSFYLEDATGLQSKDQTLGDK